MFKASFLAFCAHPRRPHNEALATISPPLSHSPANQTLPEISIDAGHFMT